MATTMNVFKPIGALAAIAYTTSTQSAVLGCDYVCLVATTAAHVAFGANPTATTSSAYLAANTPYYFECDPSDKVAVIQNAAGGNLFVTKLG